MCSITACHKFFVASSVILNQTLYIDFWVKGSIFQGYIADVIKLIAPGYYSRKYGSRFSIFNLQLNFFFLVEERFADDEIVLKRQNMGIFYPIFGN